MSIALESVRRARITLKSRNSSDLSQHEQIEDLVAEAQTIIAAMNAAKVKALREAEAPFLEQLASLDREMAVLITLLG